MIKKNLPFNIPWECLHHDVVSAEMVAALREELISLLSNAVKDQQDMIAQSSKMVLYDDNDKQKGLSPTSIDFKP